VKRVVCCNKLTVSTNRDNNNSASILFVPNFNGNFRITFVSKGPSHQLLVRTGKIIMMGCTCRLYEMGRQETHIEFWWRSILESSHLKDQESDGRITLKEKVVRRGCGWN
jgi:hypothetical protein